MTAQQRADGESIYPLLLREIRSGALSADGYLKEVEVAERFGVSRTPVRDALNRLVHERLLERTPKGLRLRQVTPEEIIQVYDVRILLEAEASAQAARNRHVTDLVGLQALLERDKALVDPSDELRARTNLEFHAAIWAAAHNPVLEDLLHRLSLHLIHKPSSTLSVGNRWDVSLIEHETMLTAIADQDADSASTLMAEHMQTARRLRLGLFAQIKSL